MSIQSINPVNGKIVKTYQEDSEEEIARKLERAQAAWLQWRTSSFQDRASLLTKLAAVLRKRKNDLAALMATEMGKPLKDGEQEAEKCATACEYYAGNGERFLSDEPVRTDASKSFVSFQPIGVVLAVMPWNFPLWQVFRFLAPAIMAGNCGVLKHASNVPGCAIAIEEMVREAGGSDGLFQTLMIGSGAVKKIIGHPLIKAVTLTGSTNAGIQVAQEAGAQLKKTVLELGGSDAYIVLEDADLDEAAEICAQSRLINNGQSCIAAKRFIVPQSIQQKFVPLFRDRLASRTTGDPFDNSTQLGPMARKDLRDELHHQVMENIKAGAQCILGGKIPEHEGDHAFYQPTLLTGVKKGMLAYSEEIFGPVASVITVKDAEDAIRVANDTSFGLGAAVFTRNIALGEKIAREQLQAGSCFVNASVKSDPRLPFGGINHSGYGRELGLVGIHEFVNIKTVYVR